MKTVLSTTLALLISFGAVAQASTSEDFLMSKLAQIHQRANQQIAACQPLRRTCQKKAVLTACKSKVNLIEIYSRKNELSTEVEFIQAECEDIIESIMHSL